MALNRTLKSLQSTMFNPVRHRQWITLDPLQRIPDSLKLRILSFNMLNQSYMWPQVYDRYVPAEYRSWEYRFPLLRETIKNDAIRSDIMCFQEMEGRVFNNVWEPMMRDWGYGCEFIKKGRPVYWDKDTKDDDLIDGVSVFYDKNKFNLINVQKFMITDYFKNEFDEKEYKNLDLDMNKVNELFKNRNQVGLIVVLRHFASNEYIIVANTHLYWKYDDVRLLQIMVLLQAMKKFKDQYRNSKIFITGDFNSNPDSSVYKFLKEDQLDISHPDISKYLKTRSYLHNQNNFFQNPVEASSNIFDKVIAQDGLFTCYTQHLFGIFDYIWFNDSDFKLLSFLSGVDRDYMNSIRGLPNKDYPSDHIPIVAEFAINR